MQKVTLIDPSNLDSLGGILYIDSEAKPAGLNVTIFNKYEPWLPKPLPGDILLVANAKISVSWVHLLAA